ncbi:MAG TPA: shikimate dehydrogenase [Leucothrix mucor]|uniref:Shikimate dehydrogenase (NADP(+)) n=1 Tax=Leucothrix mucor TaxID=45248 RepID=A0A7V2WVH4_LEUMU|nr:shikimate dehydrogenase [Leucothrix mucor]
MSKVAIDHYAVIGNPIAHSKSPLIHSMFAQQTNDAMSYNTVLSPLDEFAATVAEFQKQGGKGLNVTVPFKEQAWELADELSDYAQAAGAVNTFVFKEDGSIYGANTDGIGLIRDLAINYHIDLKGKRVLLLGAGGAAKGVVQPLLEQNIKCLIIANRTEKRATTLATDFTEVATSLGCEIQGGSYNDLRKQGQFDLIINATAASLQGIMPPMPESCLYQQSVCYDMMYGNRPTAFECWCEDNGAALVVNGLGMLIEQAAESYSLWRARQPDTKLVLDSFLAGIS